MSVYHYSIDRHLFMIIKSILEHNGRYLYLLRVQVTLVSTTRLTLD